MGLSSQLASSSLARPGVCTSSTRPASPFTGQVIYETDTGYLRVWDGAAWDYLSQSQNDTTNFPIADIGKAQQTWTPTWTAVTTNPAIGNGSLNGRYFQINKLVIAEMTLITGSTTTYGSGRWRFTFPVTAASGNIGTYGFRSLGYGRIYDTSTGQTYVAMPLFFASETSRFSVLVTGNVSQVDLNVPMTWASGDELTIQIIYEAA